MKIFKKPTVSIIIPCYNQGHFVEDAVHSILVQTLDEYEIIIVNDGSTDSFTHQLLSSYHKERVSVLHTNNQGLAAARNNGIRIATGKYILPLDADDKIGPEYLQKAVEKLESDQTLGIVYCKAQLFGAVDTDWILPQYSLNEMLLDNVIFCTAMFRRSDWDLVGGYDQGMVYGWEDYDFWLSLIEQGRGVYQIPEIHFYYRVSSDSMVRSKEKWQKAAMFKRIFARHQKLFAQHIDVWIDTLLTARECYYTSRLYVDTGNGVSDASSIARKIEKGTRVIDFLTTDFVNIVALRFDPVDTYAVVQIEKIVLEYNSAPAREVMIANISSNACIQDEGLCYFDSNDPQFFLNCTDPELSSVRNVRVYLQFVALGEEALLLTVKKLQNMLSIHQAGCNGGTYRGMFKKIARPFTSI